MSSQTPPFYHAASNENLFGVSPKVTAALQDALTRLPSYPHPDAAPLREAIAAKLGIQASQVMVGSGSAELISLLVRTFCRPAQETSVLSLSPTYPLYRAEADALGIAYQEVPLDSAYQMDVDTLLAKVDKTTRLLFISNPNNPTGSYLNQVQLERLLLELPPHVTLVLDEAYAEYVRTPDYTSALPYLEKYQNLVVLRTFSKAYGLASLRIGYMVAQEPLLEKVLQVKQPYNVNQLAQVAAQAALEDEEFLSYTLEATAAGKQHLQQALDQLGIHYWPSEGNFILIDAGIQAEAIFEHLLRHGIRVRRTDDAYTLRITIGQKEHQDHLIQILQDMLAPDNLQQHAALTQILKTGQVIHQGDEAASFKATDALAAMASVNGKAPERIAVAFARAFSARNHQHLHNAGNLYSSTYGTMDMLSAFNVLVQATPLVTFGHYFANTTIAAAVQQEREIHLVDLGIGSGLQWLHLLNLLAQRPEGAPALRITGIDLPATSGDPDQRLRETGARLQQHAEKLGIPFHYTGIASRLEDINLQMLEFRPDEVLVVNSALTLHHLPDRLVEQHDQRDRVLQQIKTLRPKVFTLTEPDSEHNKLNFMPRLRESLRHYYTVFDVLDTLLPVDMPERQIIEQEFFGREIINVISSEGSDRVERHERNEAWQRRLIRTGFQPYVQPYFADQIRKDLGLHEHFTMVPNAAGYTLYWKGTPVIAATAFTVNN
ncbi:histidinol-phosphate transaminase [Pontibacter ruber]|uniref:Histidinol-phosphate aminotransferase n=1 Tax=Pontibacter ruber TaxID=1343895 RepID=A0ABW5CYD3_9BACT|nr:histidinol-phosphate transaminase [Pontibacter ruber]